MRTFNLTKKISGCRVRVEELSNEALEKRKQSHWVVVWMIGMCMIFIICLGILKGETWLVLLGLSQAGTSVGVIEELRKIYREIERRREE